MGEQNIRVELKSMGYFLKNKLQLRCLINPLEEERRKIEAFGGELPLCMILLNDVIDQLKHECEEKVEHEEMDWENDAVEMDWIGYDQNWNTNCNEHNSNFINDFYEMENDNAACVEYENSNEDFLVTNEENNVWTSLPDLYPENSAPTNPTMSNDDKIRTRQKKTEMRRCWSPELHRHFVATLQELNAATPKRIRERMMIRGLKNNEVRIHLQKYKLHNRRMQNSRQFISPQGTLQPA